MRLWPQSLLGRLMLLWACLHAALAFIAIGLNWLEHDLRTNTLRREQITKDLLNMVEVFDNLPELQRWQVSAILSRPPYLIDSDFSTHALLPTEATECDNELAQIAEFIEQLLVVHHAFCQQLNHRLMRYNVQYQDGSPLSITLDVHKARKRERFFLFWVLSAALILAFGAWLSMRLVINPLSRLAQAADAFTAAGKFKPLPEQGAREVVSATKSFNLMQQRIINFIEARSRMLMALTHDIRTPITRLKLRSELLTDDNVRQALLRDVDEITQITNQSLAYARSINLEPNLEKQWLNVAHWFSDLANDWQNLDIDIVFNGLSDPIYWYGHRTLLDRAVANLIDNGLRYGQTDLAVSLRQVDTNAILTISDRGPGLSDQQLTHIGEPFQRESSRSRQLGGSGLGLAISKNLLDNTQAMLTVSNRKHGGLRVEIQLTDVRTQPPV